ncbi:MAG: SURF1 family protein [Acidimicrobiia bacterium]
MDRKLLRPGLLVVHLLVVVLAVVFVRLGLWQLDRLEERRLVNTVGEQRYSAEPVALGSLLSGADGDLDSLLYRRAVLTGRFDPANEMLIRSQVYRGTAGFHVITPLVGEDGTAVLVNRGWVPLILDQVPVSEAAPPEGTVTVEGWVRLTQERQALGPVDPPEGRLTALSRVDIARIQNQVPYELAPVYLVLIGEQGNEIPVPLKPPTFDDDGPHLGYAIQWFSFALIGVIGYGFLLRRRLSASG